MRYVRIPIYLFYMRLHHQFTNGSISVRSTHATTDQRLPLDYLDAIVYGSPRRTGSIGRTRREGLYWRSNCAYQVCNMQSSRAEELHEAFVTTHLVASTSVRSLLLTPKLAICGATGRQRDKDGIT